MSWKTTTLRPVRDDSPLNWTSTAGNVHYTEVDDLAPDEDVTYVQSNRSGQQDTYNPTTIATIWGHKALRVQRLIFFIRARKTHFPENWQVACYPTGFGTITPTFHNLTTGYVLYNQQFYFYDDPTQTPISKNNVEEMNIQIESKASGILVGAVRVTQIYVYVYYDYLVVPGYGRIAWTP